MYDHGVQLTDRHRDLMLTLRRDGPLSRAELHRQLHLRPNTVGELADELLSAGWIAEGDPMPVGPGRPQKPLAVSRGTPRVLGIAVRPDRLDMVPLDLVGDRSLKPQSQSREHQADSLETELAQLLQELDPATTVAVGISLPGVLDTRRNQLVVSSASHHRQAPFHLQKLRDLCEVPVLVDNDIHAVAAQWMLQRRINAEHDSLLVYLGDGELGSALLIHGRPNHGVTIGGNELGHMRFFTPTEPCYCGQRGCLERIVSTSFLRQRGMTGTLAELAATDDWSQGPTAELCKHLAMGLANAINFVRPNRVHVISPLATATPFRNAVEDVMRPLVLPGLSQEVATDWSLPPEDGFSQAAAWLALTHIYFKDWQDA